MPRKLNDIFKAAIPPVSKQDAARIEKPVFALMRQADRLQGLFVLALPCVGGLLLLYGVYDSLRMHDYHNALVVASMAAIFFCPVVLTVLAELNQRKFIRWLASNVDALATGEAVYRGVKVSAHSEVVTFDLAFSVVIASFKIPSQMFIVGQHRIWPWRIAYTLLSFVFGWWGVPWGPVFTVQSLHRNLTTKNRARLIDMIDLPGWEGGGGSFGAILPKP